MLVNGGAAPTSLCKPPWAVPGHGAMLIFAPAQRGRLAAALRTSRSVTALMWGLFPSQPRARRRNRSQHNAMICGTNKQC